MAEREIRDGDVVEIRLTNSSGGEETFSGQVQQVAKATDGSKSYIVACPFQVGPEHIRVIVPVEHLKRAEAADPRVRYIGDGRDAIRLTDRR